jgi:Uma2 family endonuclease
MAHAAVTTTRLTADEFIKHPAAQERSELISGAIHVMSPTGGPHGTVVGNLFGLLNTYVRAHRLGRCFPDNTGFNLTQYLPARAGDTVRSPDVAFVRADRIPHGGFPNGFIRLAPDLAVEVLSPDETASQLASKIADYRAAGTPLIWVIDPDERLVNVLAADAPHFWLREGDTLDGGSVIPGFTCPVVDLFEDVPGE